MQQHVTDSVSGLPQASVLLICHRVLLFLAFGDLVVKRDVLAVRVSLAVRNTVNKRGDIGHIIKNGCTPNIPCAHIANLTKLCQTVTSRIGTKRRHDSWDVRLIG